MSSAMPAGASFIHTPVLTHVILTPEKISSEQKQFYTTAHTFARDEVETRVEEIDHKKPGVLVDLMRRAAELGLFMVSIPEEFGGLGLDKTTSMLITETMSHVGSFGVSYGGHTGIGSLPLVYYGTKAQKKKYLPKLATGELLCAYALSEAGSGSDALGAKTLAKLSKDGKYYVLSGSKQWITNASFADLFTVFAQVDGDQFTAFLVERTMPGVSIGKEERKLGIRGSSTCSVILDDVHVPVENLLGEVGKGHKIAFNILNIGRLKLGAGSVGAAKNALGHGVRYAKERRQFKKPIATFGLIREKFANAATAIYAGESMVYRTTGIIDDRIASLNPKAEDYSSQSIKAIEEFTVECSILKVFGSEALYMVADEMLQIHGGNGYTEDYPLERILRDARINRIFEGTNEINRLIIPATVLKRALQGRLPIMDFMGQIMAELAEPAKLPQKSNHELANEIQAVELVKRAIVYAASYAAQKYMEDLKEKQRLLGNMAESFINVYAMDSVLARAHQAKEERREGADIHRALAALFCFDARPRVFQHLRRMAMMMAEGEELDALYKNLGELDQRYRVDYMGLQNKVAEHVLEKNGYVV